MKYNLLKYALIDTGLYLLFIIGVIGVLVVSRSDPNDLYVGAPSGIFSTEFLFGFITFGIWLYGIKVFLLSLIYRSTSSTYLLRGEPLQKLILGLLSLSVLLFAYWDYHSLTVTYTTLTAENTVQGLLTWVALAANAAILIFSSIVGSVLLIINSSMLEKRTRH